MSPDESWVGSLPNPRVHPGTSQVVYVLTTPKRLIVNPNEETLDDIWKRQKWENANEICHGHILNTMSDGLFDVYYTIATEKELWDRLQAKYLREDATSKKFCNLLIITRW